MTCSRHVANVIERQKLKVIEHLWVYGFWEYIYIYASTLLVQYARDHKLPSCILDLTLPSMNAPADRVPPLVVY